jgi:hypothetical protein
VEDASREGEFHLLPVMLVSWNSMVMYGGTGLMLGREKFLEAFAGFERLCGYERRPRRCDAWERRGRRT